MTRSHTHTHTHKDVQSFNLRIFPYLGLSDLKCGGDDEQAFANIGISCNIDRVWQPQIIYHCAIHCSNQPPRLCQLDGNHSAIHINHPPAASPNFSSASEVTEHILLQKIQRWWPNAPAIEQLQILTWLAQGGSSEAGNST